jgi:hypothetical protein
VTVIPRVPLPGREVRRAQRRPGCAPRSAQVQDNARRALLGFTWQEALTASALASVARPAQCAWPAANVKTTPLRGGLRPARHLIDPSGMYHDRAIRDLLVLGW